MESAEKETKPSVFPGRDFAIASACALLVLLFADASLRDSNFSRSLDMSASIPVKAKLMAASRFDIVVAGSSVIAEGVNPTILSDRIHELTGQKLKVFNAGVSAGGFDADFLTADHIVELPPERRPLFFIFSVSPMEFSCCPHTELPTEDKWGAALRVNDLGPLLEAAPSFEEVAKDLTLTSFRSLAIRSNVLAALFDRQSPGDPWKPPADGGGGTIGAVDAATQNARATHRAQAFAAQMMKPRYIDRWLPARFISTMVARLARAGVKTAMIGNPQAPQLAVLNGPDSIYPEYAEYLPKLGKELGSGFTNFRDMEGLGAADFVDGDHLNSGGSAKYSRKLAEEVIVPMMKGESAKP
jgi:hypothetical protein